MKSKSTYLKFLTSSIQTIKKSLLRKHSVINGTIAEYLLVFLVYLFIATIFTGSVMFNINSQIFADRGDATVGFLWLNTTDQSIDPVIDEYTMSNYPQGEKVAGLTLISYMTYWFPMRVASILTSPVAALNIIMYLGYLFTAISMYIFAKRTTGKPFVALISGAAAAFVPYAIIKSSSHMSYIFGGIFALILAAFITLWHRPSYKKAAILGVLFALTFYTDGYFMLMSIVTALGMIIAGVVYLVVTKSKLLDWIIRVKMFAVSLAVFILLLTPLLATFLLKGDQIQSDMNSNRSNITTEIIAYRSDPLDLILPAEEHPFWSHVNKFNELNEEKNTRSNQSENTNYIAYTVYVVCAAGLLLVAYRLLLAFKNSNKIKQKKILKDEKTLILITVSTVAILCLMIMFSPAIHVMGVKIPLPGQIFIDQQIALWRVMSRLFVVYNIAVVAWFAVSLSMILDLIKNRIKNHKKWTYIKVLLLCFVSTLLIFEYAYHSPRRPFDFNKDVAGTYYWIKNQKDIKSIAELPFVDPLDVRSTEYFTAQTVHHKNLINMKSPGSTRLNISMGDDLNGETLDFIISRNADAFIIRSKNECKKDYPHSKLVYSESNIETIDVSASKLIQGYLCTYKIDKSGYTPDPVFAVFQDGFSPSANAPDQSDIAFKDGSRGIIKITDSSLVNTFNGKAKFSAKLRLLSDVKNAEWTLRQNGTVISKGTVADKNAIEIDSIIDGRNKLELSVNSSKRPLKIAEVYLEEVKINKVY